MNVVVIYVVIKASRNNKEILNSGLKTYKILKIPLILFTPAITIICTIYIRGHRVHLLTLTTL